MRISDTYAEIFPMWAGRILVTAHNQKWALKAAEAATGFATSIIMCPAEAARERILSPDKTPDGRLGVVIQIYSRSLQGLRDQMILRTGQCIMTCPTTAAYDALPKAERRLKIGRSLRLFGDGFQKRDKTEGRVVWRIPVMEGEFFVEDTFGAVKGSAGGTLLLMAESQRAGLEAAERAVGAISQRVEGAIMPFPGGVCRSGSKVGSTRYKLRASTNHPFCPKLKKIVPDSEVPDGVECVYEIVINGLTVEAIKRAMVEGVRVAAESPGILKISAANFGGKLGPIRVGLKEILEL
ncbi:MAG: formylmethanofuran--tetrahydromethanopterin N-formyltransferase [Candidatus Bathyarchaeota archaeon]|nr:formylmethanofuran--tetrahydromethanopterin N-formyltransferase [Candidatus Bathyarchaeota archaeon]